MSQTKKIFELNHNGKIRLTEISETVSCNCTFASGRDLRLHIIWVMMNILNVNENDDILYQKSHTKDTVLILFRKLKYSTTPSTSSGTDMQNMQCTDLAVQQPFQQTHQIPVDESGNPGRTEMLRESNVRVSQDISFSQEIEISAFTLPHPSQQGTTALQEKQQVSLCLSIY